MKVNYTVLDHAYSEPKYATLNSSGLDLFCAFDKDQILNPLERILVPTGICIEVPEGYEAQIRPRSGLAHKHGVTVLNAPGTIDADYRGEIFALLINLGGQSFLIQRGMRIAQLVIASVTQITLNSSEILTKTTRGTGGLGSTGC